MTADINYARERIKNISKNIDFRLDEDVFQKIHNNVAAKTHFNTKCGLEKYFLLRIDKLTTKAVFEKTFNFGKISIGKAYEHTV